MNGTRMKVLAIVPARGGSKRIPRKNIASLLGKPLLADPAEAARAARRLTRALLSTEDEEIAHVGRQYGLDVPFLRPPELARDDTPTIAVFQALARPCRFYGRRNWRATTLRRSPYYRTWFGSLKPWATVTMQSSCSSRPARS